MNKAEKYIYKKHPKEKGYNRHFNMEQTVQLLEGYAKQENLKLENNPTYWKEKYENIKFHYEKENKQLKEQLKNNKL